MIDGVDDDVRMQRAFENGIKQLDHIFELRRKLMEK